MNCTTDHIGHVLSDSSSTEAAEFSLASICGHCLTSTQHHSITRKKKNRNPKRCGVWGWWGNCDVRRGALEIHSGATLVPLVTSKLPYAGNLWSLTDNRAATGVCKIARIPGIIMSSKTLRCQLASEKFVFQKTAAYSVQTPQNLPAYFSVVYNCHSVF